MQQIERIRGLIQYLPKVDISLANTFIDTRDFESLQELVDSAIIKARRNLKSDNPREEYLSLDMDILGMLKADVDVYVALLELPSNEEEYEEEY